MVKIIIFKGEFIFANGKERLDDMDGLKWWRRDRYFTADKLAGLLGFHTRTINGYEQGNPIPKSTMIALKYLENQIKTKKKG